MNQLPETAYNATTHGIHTDTCGTQSMARCESLELATLYHTYQPVSSFRSGIRLLSCFLWMMSCLCGMLHCIPTRDVEPCGMYGRYRPNQPHVAYHKTRTTVCQSNHHIYWLIRLILA